jgi:hypothetical protein
LLTLWLVAIHRRRVGDVIDEPEERTPLDELLSEASRLGWGIAFEPDGDGWYVSYLVPVDINCPGANDRELASRKLSEAASTSRASRTSARPTRATNSALT